MDQTNDVQTSEDIHIIYSGFRVHGSNPKMFLDGDPYEPPLVILPPTLNPLYVYIYMYTREHMLLETTKTISIATQYKTI